MSAISASNPNTSAPGGHSLRGQSLRVWGIPIGGFGLFASTLIAVALGFIAFFGVTFASIFGLLIYNSAGRHHITLDTSYKFIGLPAGIAVLLLSFTALVGIWLRRRLTGRS